MEALKISNCISRLVTLSGFPKRVRKFQICNMTDLSDQYKNFTPNVQAMVDHWGMKFTVFAKAWGRVTTVPWAVQFTPEGVIGIMDSRIFGDRNLLQRCPMEFHDIPLTIDWLVTNKSEEIGSAIVDMADSNNKLGTFCNLDLLDHLGDKKKLRVSMHHQRLGMLSTLWTKSATQ